MDICELADLLGHASLGTTMMYLPTALADSRPHYLRCHPLCQGALRIPSASPTHQEILDLLEAATPGRDQAVIRTLYATALRESELIELDCADLDLDELRVFVRDGKGPKDRYTLIDAGTAELLRSRPRGALFPISRMTVWNILKVTAKRTGLWQTYKARGLRVSPHTLRHAYATHCYLAGMPLPIVAKLMGHSHEDDTLQYLHPTPEFEAAAYARTSSSEGS